MVDNTEKRFASSYSLEGTPSLYAVEPYTVAEIRRAQNEGKQLKIADAVTKAGDGAGQTELDWVLTNPLEARKMLIKKGKDNILYFFPNAASGDLVPFVFWSGGIFQWNWYRSDGRWLDNACIVQVR